MSKKLKSKNKNIPNKLYEKGQKTINLAYTEANLPQMIQDIEQKYGKKAIISEKGKTAKARLDAQKVNA